MPASYLFRCLRRALIPDLDPFEVDCPIRSSGAGGGGPVGLSSPPWGLGITRGFPISEGIAGEKCSGVNEVEGDGIQGDKSPNLPAWNISKRTLALQLFFFLSDRGDSSQLIPRRVIIFGRASVFCEIKKIFWGPPRAEITYLVWSPPVGPKDALLHVTFD